MHVQTGEIVRALRGHDAEQFFCVLNVEDDFVYLADGKRRTVANPKKKRHKHVASEGIWTHPVTERIQAGAPVLDSELRRALAAFRDKKFSETKEV